MSVNVLVLEDRESTRQVIRGYLESNLSRDASETDDPDPDAAGGRLAHVLPRGWQPFRRRDFKICCANDGEITELTMVARATDRSRLREYVTSLCVETFDGEPELPHVLVVDLALSGWEQNELMAKEAHWPSLTCKECALPAPDSEMEDPRGLVEEMTGYRVIGALAGELPIIATSYASHPLVSYCCLVNGARAFIRKPVREKETIEGREGWDWATAARYGPEELQMRGEQAIDPLAAVVLNYLTTLTAQILAVLPNVALEQLGECREGDPRGPAPVAT
jgi:CheY-like chemotaxis protein